MLVQCVENGLSREINCRNIIAVFCFELQAQMENTSWSEEDNSIKVPIFSCPFCPYTTRFGTTFKRHIHAHTGERPYECANCGRRFIQKHEVKKHACRFS